jgi:transcriptional regulator with XRE-family HTH domain
MNTETLTSRSVLVGPLVIDSPVGAEDFSATLQSLRDRSCLTVEALSSALGVSRQTYYNWLYGEEPTAENAVRINRLAKLIDDQTHGLTPRQAKRRLLSRSQDGTTVLDGLAALVTEVAIANQQPLSGRLLVEVDEDAPLPSVAAPKRRYAVSRVKRGQPL